ncbi:MAG: PilZ domain-containing protein [Methylococcaceae bacterium]|nr:MAG: PilZ domain-containing protein [Methylococcaceae bacterium]
MMTEQRRYYRKNLRQTGILLRDAGEEEFFICDLSLKGIRAHFEVDPRLVVGQEVHIRMPGLKLEGYVVPVRCRPADQGGFDVGFDFIAIDGVEDNAYRYRAEMR